jgi:hypothetical protein
MNKMNLIKFLKNNYILLPFFIIVLLIHLKLSNYIFDDAYIHFRIAENLINFSFPYYNITNPFMSSSSSLWTILLAGVYSIFNLYYIYFIICLNSLLLISNIYIYKTAIENHSNIKMSLIQQLLFSLLFISVSLVASVGLMETNLALFLSGISLLYIQKNKAVGFLFLSLAIFTRLEFAILYLLFSIYFIFKNGVQSILQIFLFSFLGSFVFIIYDLYFFGTLIPLTVHAKSIVYDIDLLNIFINKIFYGKYISLLLFTLLIVSALINKEKIKITPLLIFSLSGFLLILAYIIKNTHLHGWYNPLYLVPITIGVFLYSLSSKKNIYYLSLIYILLFPFYKSYFIDTFNIIKFTLTNNKQYIPNFNSKARVRSYLDISAKLYKKYPNSVLMTSEIGGIGYGFKGYILDGMGLIQDDCLKYHPMSVPNERSSGGIGAIPIGCVKEKMPDIIMGYDIFIQSLSKNMVLDQYTQYKLPTLVEDDLNVSSDSRVWGSKYLNVFIRKDIDKGI